MNTVEIGNAEIKALIKELFAAIGIVGGRAGGGGLSGTAAAVDIDLVSLAGGDVGEPGAVRVGDAKILAVVDEVAAAGRGRCWRAAAVDKS